MRIALHSRFNKESAGIFVQQIISELELRKCEILVTPEFKTACNTSSLKLSYYKTIDNKKDLRGVDAFFSLGGDGTLLETVSIIGDLEIPILGVNLGTLGFLATISKLDIASSISSYFDGNYTIDARMLLRLESDDSAFGNVNFALNEIALLKRDTSAMIIVHCYIDDKFINTYWADGLMIATPTGSTGYSLSCGGPIVSPDLDSYIITPVSPHNLNVRPLVVSADSTISFEIESKGKNFLASLDSRSYKVHKSAKISVRKEQFKAQLIKLKGYNFYNTLRNKLNWGLDIRN